MTADWAGKRKKLRGTIERGRKNRKAPAPLIFVGLARYRPVHGGLPVRFFPKSFAFADRPSSRGSLPPVKTFQKVTPRWVVETFAK